MATVTYEIDRRDFERWLGEQGERKFQSGSYCHCPVAEYLSEVIGVPVQCTSNSFFPSHSKGGFLLPEWAKQFIHRVDLGMGETPKASVLLPMLRQILEDAA